MPYIRDFMVCCEFIEYLSCTSHCHALHANVSWHTKLYFKNYEHGLHYILLTRHLELLYSIPVIIVTWFCYGSFGLAYINGLEQDCIISFGNAEEILQFGLAYINGLEQDCIISFGNAEEILQFGLAYINGLEQDCIISFGNAEEILQFGLAFINGLEQDCSISFANAEEILQFCTKPLISSSFVGGIVWFIYHLLISSRITSLAEIIIGCI